MPIEGFDYKEFATSMAEQAKELVPKDLQDREKEYIVKTLGNFTLLAGEALYNDEQLNLTAEQAVFVTQVIAEWSYHKSIDLIHSGILPQYWDSIMQKIAFTIFEVAKQAIIRKIPQDQLLQAVEHHVVRVYNSAIEELQKKGIIDEATKSRAESQSNIDAMAKQAQEEQQRQQMAKADAMEKNLQDAEARREERRNKRRQEKQLASMPKGISNKQMKLMTLALVLKILSQDKVTTILNKFDSNDSLEISQYMNMADLESHLDGDLVSNCLKEMKEYLPIKRKLTQENVLGDLLRIYQSTSREKIEKIVKNERPLVKRFIAQAYDGEYSGLPLKVADIVAQYIEDSI